MGRPQEVVVRLAEQVKGQLHHLRISSHGHARAFDVQRDGADPLVRIGLVSMRGQRGHGPIADVIIEVLDGPFHNALRLVPGRALYKHRFARPC